MKNISKHLWLVISLILAASLILLMSDRVQRFSHVKKNTQAYPSIAVMQIASTAMLDSFVTGMNTILRLTTDSSALFGNC